MLVLDPLALPIEPVLRNQNHWFLLSCNVKRYCRRALFFLESNPAWIAVTVREIDHVCLIYPYNREAPYAGSEDLCIEAGYHMSPLLPAIITSHVSGFSGH